MYFRGDSIQIPCWHLWSQEAVDQDNRELRITYRGNNKYLSRNFIGLVFDQVLKLRTDSVSLYISLIYICLDLSK
jgi:hypothetical protein